MIFFLRLWHFMTLTLQGPINNWGTVPILSCPLNLLLWRVIDTVRWAVKDQRPSVPGPWSQLRPTWSIQTQTSSGISPSRPLPTIWPSGPTCPCPAYSGCSRHTFGSCSSRRSGWCSSLWTVWKHKWENTGTDSISLTSRGPMKTHRSGPGPSDSGTQTQTCRLSRTRGCFLTSWYSENQSEESFLSAEPAQCFQPWLTEGTEQLVEVAGLPFLGEGDVEDVISVRLHWNRRRSRFKLKLASVKLNCHTELQLAAQNSSQSARVLPLLGRVVTVGVTHGVFVPRSHTHSQSGPVMLR